MVNQNKIHAIYRFLPSPPSSDVNCFLVPNNMTKDLKGIELTGKIYYQDINECESNVSNNCHKKNEVCVNTFSSYLCVCKSGFKPDSSGICVDIDECNETNNPCQSHHHCLNNIGSFECVEISNRQKKNSKNRPNLDINCPRGKWGKNCSNACGACKNYRNCNSFNGICKNGCLKGFITKYCNETATVTLNKKKRREIHYRTLNGIKKMCHPLYTCHNLGICVNGKCKCQDELFGLDCRETSGFHLLEKFLAFDSYYSQSLSVSSLIQCKKICVTNDCNAFEFDPHTKEHNW